MFGSLVRRRTWQRVRRKRKKHIRKKSDLVNPFFTTTAQPKFIARITTSNGDVVSIWRPQVPGTKMILGDVVMKGNNPPEKMTVVDPAKVLNSRSEVQREWVKRAAIFKSVWDNGKVYMWRPVVPTVPARFLQRKHLHPLGWIFTTSPAPPDLENVSCFASTMIHLSTYHMFQQRIIHPGLTQLHSNAATHRYVSYTRNIYSR